MTIIARSTFRGVPVFFGDVLLSSDLKSQHEVAIPATSNINAKLPDGVERNITGIAQKLNILSPRLIVCWAGSLVQGRAMLRDLSALDQKSKKLTTEMVFAAIDAVPERERDDLSIIGSICNADSSGGVELLSFLYQANVGVCGDAEYAVSGSGTAEFFKLVEGLMPKMGPIPQSIDSGLYEYAEQFSYSMLALCVGEEMLLGRNLLEWWGGAFEFAGLRNGRFEKLGGNTVFLFFKVIRAEGSASLRFTPVFLKYDYIDQSLLIQKICAVGRPDGQIAVASHDIHLCSPLLEASPREISVPGFDCKTLCCITLDVQNGEVEQGIRIFYDSDGCDLFSLEAQQSELVIKLKPDLRSALIQDAESQLGIPVSFDQFGY